MSSLLHPIATSLLCRAGQSVAAMADFIWLTLQETEYKRSASLDTTAEMSNALNQGCMGYKMNAK